jgi:hypothetical protein
MHPDGGAAGHQTDGKIAAPVRSKAPTQRRSQIVDLSRMCGLLII